MKKLAIGETIIVKAGSVVEYDSFVEKNPKIVKLLETNDKLRTTIRQALIKFSENAAKLKALADQLSNEDFPEDPKSNEGKEGFTYVQEMAQKQADEALEIVMHLRVG